MVSFIYFLSFCNQTAIQSLGSRRAQREDSHGRHFAATDTRTLYQIVSDKRISHSAPPCSPDSPGEMSWCTICLPEWWYLNLRAAALPKKQRGDGSGAAGDMSGPSGGLHKASTVKMGGLRLCKLDLPLNAGLKLWNNASTDWHYNDIKPNYILYKHPHAASFLRLL